MTKIISIQDEKDLEKRKPGKIETAISQQIGRTLLDERLQVIDQLFTPEGLRKVGFGEKTVKFIESKGALALYKSKIHATLGSGLLGDRYHLTNKNDQAFNELIASYHYWMERYTITNTWGINVNCRKIHYCFRLGHPTWCPGRDYAPGAMMRDGEEHPWVQRLALDALEILANHMGRSLYKWQVEQQPIVPLEELMPKGYQLAGGPGIGRPRTAPTAPPPQIQESSEQE